MINRKEVVNEANVGITICTFLGTVALFFTGLLISRLDAFNQSIKVGVLYLIVSTFGLIFSAIIYSNAAGESNTEEIGSEFKFITIGNAISEFLGVYPFVVAIPLVINALTNDTFLRASTFIIALISLVIYTMSRFSIVARGSNMAIRTVISFLVAVFLLLLIFGQSSSQGFFEAVSLTFLGVLAILAVYYRHRS